MTDTPMTCPSPEDLSAFHDGELVASERARVERHVASCADCATALARIQRASSLLSALPREEASAELVREVAQKAVGRRRPAKWHLMALPLASAAAMLALSFLLLRMTREETMHELAPGTIGARMNDAKRGAETDSPSATGKKEKAPGAMPAPAPDATLDATAEDKLAEVDDARLRRPELQASSGGPAPLADAVIASAVIASAERAKEDTPKSVDSEKDQDAADENAAARDDSAFAPEPPADLASNARRQAAPAAAAMPPASPAPMAKARAAGEAHAPVEGSVMGGVIGGVVGGTLGADVAQQPASPSTPITIGPGVTPPVLVKRVEHDCPVPARASVVQGEIILSCVVDEQGAIRVERVLKSIPRCDQAAITAVNQWVYQPAVFEGHPQAVHLVLRVNAFTR